VFYSLFFLGGKFQIWKDEVSDFEQSGWSKFRKKASSDWFKLMRGWLGKKFRSVAKSSDSETLATLMLFQLFGQWRERAASDERKAYDF
jgi:hypothetical protein